MEKLQAILAAKKNQPKVINHKEVIQKQKKQFIEQQQQLKKQQQQKGKRKLQQLHEFYDQTRKLVKKNQELENDNITKQVEQMTKEQIIKQLRQFQQPITFFGQSDNDRKKRLIKLKKQIQKTGTLFKNKNKQQAYQKKLKQLKQYQELDTKYRSKMIQPKLMNNLQLRKQKVKMVQTQKNNNYQQICDSIYLWAIKVLRDWNQQFQHKYHNSIQTSTAKTNYARYQQTNDNLKSFFKVLKARGGDKQMVTSIYHIMNCCLVREYVMANDKYLQLSIGNAPWPMGVAMLGISVKRNAQRLSHVLNQQMTRKWVQSFKRLVSVSQQLYPNEDIMKMVGYSVNSMI